MRPIRRCRLSGSQSGVWRPWAVASQMSASDPKRTFLWKGIKFNALASFEGTYSFHSGSGLLGFRGLTRPSVRTSSGNIIDTTPRQASVAESSIALPPELRNRSVRPAATSYPRSVEAD